ncbi:hypothetical protein TgHK011_009198 [Trichoderma gracile]|nr:hypothetical protein TgHK011_009198 [Trichoderma gracile]
MAGSSRLYDAVHRHLLCRDSMRTGYVLVSEEREEEESGSEYSGSTCYRNNSHGQSRQPRATETRPRGQQNNNHPPRNNASANHNNPNTAPANSHRSSSITERILSTARHNVQQEENRLRTWMRVIEDVHRRQRHQQHSGATTSNGNAATSAAAAAPAARNGQTGTSSSRAAAAIIRGDHGTRQREREESQLNSYMEEAD